MIINEKAEKYLEGLLSRSEKISFEEELRKNKDLQEYIKNRIKLDKKLSVFFNDKIENELKSEISNDINEFGNDLDMDKDESERKFKSRLKKTISRKPQRGNIILFLSIAASISLLIIISAGLIKKSSEIKSNKLMAEVYNSFFNPAEDIFLLQNNDLAFFNSGIESKDSLYQKYKLNNHSELLRSNELNESAVLSLALISLQKNDFENAEYFLKYIINNEKDQFNNTPEWYYSLCLIALNKPREAKIILEKIKTQNGNYSKDAGQLLDAIKNF